MTQIKKRQVKAGFEVILEILVVTATVLHPTASTLTITYAIILVEVCFKLRKREKIVLCLLEFELPVSEL
jgi:hypothetical protein